MKTPIKPSDIRKGDLIRVEFIPTVESHPHRALEYRAVADGSGMTARLDKWGAKRRDYYLLDRPTPAVELPAEPTLGWLTYAGSTIFGVFRKYDPSDYSRSDGIDWDVSEIRDGAVFNSFNSVTAFTPATAVPADALDFLRANVDCSGPLSCLREHVEAFLAAVDKANGGAA